MSNDFCGNRVAFGAQTAHCDKAGVYRNRNHHRAQDGRFILRRTSSVVPLALPTPRAATHCCTAHNAIALPPLPSPLTRSELWKQALHSRPRADAGPWPRSAGCPAAGKSLVPSCDPGVLALLLLVRRVQAFVPVLYKKAPSATCSFSWVGACRTHILEFFDSIPIAGVWGGISNLLR